MLKKFKQDLAWFIDMVTPDREAMLNDAISCTTRLAVITIGLLLIGLLLVIEFWPFWLLIWLAYR